MWPPGLTNGKRLRKVLSRAGNAFSGKTAFVIKKLKFASKDKMQEVNIEVDQGRGIPSPKFMCERNTYLVVKVSSSNKTHKTKIDRRSLFPVWKAKFRLNARPDDYIHFELHDADGATGDHNLANMDIKVSEIPIGRGEKKWYTMASLKPRTHKMQVLMGMAATKPPVVEEESMAIPGIPTVNYPEDAHRIEEEIPLATEPPSWRLPPPISTQSYVAQPVVSQEPAQKQTAQWPPPIGAAPQATQPFYPPPNVGPYYQEPYVDQPTKPVNPYAQYPNPNSGQYANNPRM